jgi:branched-chain amino acid transport system ATP-binding protein
MILEVDDLTVAYGRVAAVKGVSLTVPDGSIIAVIGANGAGKTSLMRGLMGQTPPVSGRVLFEGREVTRTRPHSLVLLGMTLVPQNRGTLAPLTVEENLELAGRRLGRSERNLECQAVYDMFPVLRDRRKVRAGLLSGGEQQTLAFGRAIVTQPKLLLLDEPSTGLSPLMTSVVMSAISTLRAERGVSILVVEQNVAAVLSVAEFAHVLDRGTIVRSGSAAELRDDEEVRDAFLGV